MIKLYAIVLWTKYLEHNVNKNYHKFWPNCYFCISYISKKLFDDGHFVNKAIYYDMAKDELIGSI